ncbi:MAG: hypothetical protein CMH60_03160 [Myxococcales bacterium]|nr:hypothetical protein [Myxococcales bacterium]
MRSSGLKMISTAVLLLSLYGCPSRTDSIDAELSNPGAMVLAGASMNKIFISNRGEEALQVFQLGETLLEGEFVKGPVQYLPLRIPCGGPVENLIASDDGNYVVFHNAAQQSLGVIDANTYEVQEGLGGSIVGFSLQEFGVAADIESSQACEDCLGRFFVSVPQAQKILQMRLLPNDPPTFELEKEWTIDGGYPETLLYTADNILFASDQEGTLLWRIDVGVDANGISSLNVGARVSALSWSSDDQVLFVARPAMQDILTVDLSAAQPTILDVNPEFGPAPSCLNACSSEVEAVCSATHQADAALCLDTDGLSLAGDRPYEALFLGAKTQSMVLVDGGASENALSIECGEEEQSHSRLLVSAGLDGSLRLSSMDGLAAGGTPQVVDSAWCEEATLTKIAGAALDAYLAPCLGSPEGRDRFVCLSQGDAGVLALPGHSGNNTWSLIWEDIILSRDNGGGVVAEDGTFYDIGVDLASIDFALAGEESESVLGDVLEILSEPRTNEEDCVLNDYQGLCSLERRIVGTTVVDGRTHLQLDAPLASGCFGGDGSVAYRIRAADRFGLYKGDDRQVFIKPGQSFGLGGDLSQEAKVSFALKEISVHGDLSACERYDSQGQALAPLDEVLSRTTTHQFAITEPFSPLEGAMTYDFSGNSLGPVGYLPGAMLLLESFYDEPIIFMTYGGSDALFAFAPLDSKSINLAQETYILAN